MLYDKGILQEIPQRILTTKMIYNNYKIVYFIAQRILMRCKILCRTDLLIIHKALYIVQLKQVWCVLKGFLWSGTVASGQLPNLMYM